MNFLNFLEIQNRKQNRILLMYKELIIAFGLFLFIEGVVYALFPSKMKNMLRKLEFIRDSQLRIGGLIFVILGFLIIYYTKY